MLENFWKRLKSVHGYLEGKKTDGRPQWFSDDWIDITEPFTRTVDGFEITLKPGAKPFKIVISDEQMAQLVAGAAQQLKIAFRRAEADANPSSAVKLLRWISDGKTADGSDAKPRRMKRSLRRVFNKPEEQKD